MSVIVELSIFPLGKGEGVSTDVARAVKCIEESGLAYRFGPMSTCIEGEWDEVMALVTRCHDELRKDSSRVLVYLRADSRDGVSRMESKMEAVERHFDAPLRK